MCCLTQLEMMSASNTLFQRETRCTYDSQTYESRSAKPIQSFQLLFLHCDPSFFGLYSRATELGRIPLKPDFHLHQTSMGINWPAIANQSVCSFLPPSLKGASPADDLASEGEVAWAHGRHFIICNCGRLGGLLVT